MITGERYVIQVTIDKGVWMEFKENMKKLGYPRQGVAGLVIQQKLEQINAEIEHLGDSQQLELFHWKKGEKRG